MKALVKLVALTASVCAFSAASAAPNDIVGYWINAEKDSIVQIAACGDGQYCGTVRSFTGKGDETDAANPDPAKQSQTICGLTIVGALKPASTGWTGGWIYDPTTGERYQLSATMASPNKLKLRGYEGMESMGETFFWERTSKVPTSCTDV